MGKRGRPFHSEIRNNIIEILYFLKEGYGYEISKLYNHIFPKVTMRSVYYHLKKGISLGEIRMKEIKKVSGDFSWGSTVEKIYYALGDKAKPKGDERVRKEVEEFVKKRDG
jgi:DNA-binding transcriptional ArsR family regulator